MISFLLLILTGAIVGILSSLFGIGGGSLLVPILFIFYPAFPASEIIAISLTVILINTISNTYQYQKLKSLPPKNIIIFFVFASIIGAITGTYIANFLDKNITQLVISFILLFLVIRSVLPIKNSKNIGRGSSSPYAFGMTGIIGTILATITGLGGGVIFTPAFQYLHKIPAKKIPAYSNIAMLFGCLFALVPHVITGQTINRPYYFGNINIQVVLLISIFSIIGTKLGVSLNHKVSAKHKTILLNTIFILLAIKLLLFRNT